MLRSSKLEAQSSVRSLNADVKIGTLTEVCVYERVMLRSSKLEVKSSVQSLTADVQIITLTKRCVKQSCLGARNS